MESATPDTPLPDWLYYYEYHISYGDPDSDGDDAFDAEETRTDTGRIEFAGDEEIEALVSEFVKICKEDL